MAGNHHQHHHHSSKMADQQWGGRAIYDSVDISPSLPTASERGLVSHLRRSELAGWRTKSLFPTRNLQDVSSAFLPILKLRGLPYFCSKRHILTWFGDLANHIVELLFIAEVEPLNSGFALVTMDSPETALSVWRKLHKKAITNRRFVEVFALLPPHCPLCRRGSVPSDAHLSTDGPPGILMPGTCSFCLTPLLTHADGGQASRATLRMRQAVSTGRLGAKGAPGLMHTAFLKVPALLYQDSGVVTRNEVDMFEPELWQSTRYHCRCACLNKFPPERLHTLEELEADAGIVRGTEPGDECADEQGVGRSTYFFDLMDIMGYDLRMLLCEIVEIVQRSRRTEAQDAGTSLLDDDAPSTGSMSIAEIGNDLSTRGRAYLFITEVKLKNVLESFSDLFSISTDPKSMLTSVNLKEATLVKGVAAVLEMEALQLTRRQKPKREPASSQRYRGGGLGDDYLSNGEMAEWEILSPLETLHRARTAAVHNRDFMDASQFAYESSRPPPPPPLDRHRSALTYVRPRSGSRPRQHHAQFAAPPPVTPPAEQHTWSTAMVAEFLQNVSVQLMAADASGTLLGGSSSPWPATAAAAAADNCWTPLSRSSTCPSSAPRRAYKGGPPVPRRSSQTAYGYGGSPPEFSHMRSATKVEQLSRRRLSKRSSVLPAEVYFEDEEAEAPPLGTFANDLPGGAEERAYMADLRRASAAAEDPPLWDTPHRVGSSDRRPLVYSDDQRLVDHMTALTLAAGKSASGCTHGGESMKHVMEDVASLLESIAGQTGPPPKPRGRRVSISTLQQQNSALASHPTPHNGYRNS